MNEKKPRMGGRRARQSLRAAPPIINAAPPAQKGGQYKPLKESEIQAIYHSALRILDELGMGEVPEKLADIFLNQGAKRSEHNRITFPPEYVKRIIEMAAKSFTLHGRDAHRSITIGGDSVHFGTGGAAVQTLDLESNRYRASTLHDLYNFTRLQDGLMNISWFTRCCVATDIPDIYELDVNTIYALMRGTTKPVATSFTLAEHIPPIIEMLDILAGGKGEFQKRPFLKAHISPVISPLRYGEDAVDVTFECIKHNIPISAITAAQSGATSPATLSGALISSLAETLASLIMVNSISPHYPMVFSNWPFVIDLRTGAFSGGSGESAVLNAASAQIINWLELPSGVASSMTDAKSIDAQYGVEKGLTALACALAGGNLIYESAGMTASLLGASFEGFLLDNEMHAMIFRMMRGIDMDNPQNDIDAIKQAILGDGHFLSHPQTMEAMERDYIYPEIGNRDTPMVWEEKGAIDASTRAKEKVREILAQKDKGYITAKEDAQIRAKFNILLPPA